MLYIGFLPWKKITEKDNYLRSYRSELVVTEKINLSLVWVTAEMQGLISINSKAQNTKEKHSNWAKKKSVELSNYCWRPELQIRGFIQHKKQKWTVLLLEVYLLFFIIQNIYFILFVLKETVCLWRVL